MKLLLTGATGFVGRHLHRHLLARGHEVVAAVRRPGQFEREALIGEIGPETDWSAALDGIDAVIHSAAVTKGPLIAVNREGSAALARAAMGRVRRFIHVSTVKVLGECADLPLDETAPLRPRDLYGRSKAEAETAVARALENSETRLTILRPPMVYGSGQDGNFQRLAALVRRGLPLPFGAVRNRRSLIHVDNLCHCIAAALDAEPRIYHVTDGRDVSTPDWIRLLARAQNIEARLFDFPPALLWTGLTVLGRHGMAQRLLGNLALNDAAAVQAFGPMPLTIEQGFERTV